MSRRSILVADDDPSTVEFNAAILRHAGHRVVTANSIEQALRLVLHEHLDVVVTDLEMGRANDGLILAGLVKRVSPATEVVMASGSFNLERALRQFQQEFDASLPKGASCQELLQLVRQSPEAQRPGSRIFADLLTRDHEQILEEWLQQVESEPPVREYPLPRHERMDHVGDLLSAVIQRLRDPECKPIPLEAEAARTHGALRRRQNYSLHAWLAETIIFRRILIDRLRQAYWEINAGEFINNLQCLNQALDDDIENSMHGWIGGDAAR